MKKLKLPAFASNFLAKTAFLSKSRACDLIIVVATGQPSSALKLEKEPKGSLVITQKNPEAKVFYSPMHSFPAMEVEA